jgi:hypothetical protein
MDGSHPHFRNVHGGMRKSFNSLISRFGVPETIVGRNLLPAFGFNFAKCLTFPINKQQLITLSRTAQSKDCTATSRTRFAHTPPRRHCLKSQELPFVLLGLRAQPREDTGLSLAEAVFGAQIVLPN